MSAVGGLSLRALAKSSGLLLMGSTGAALLAFVQGVFVTRGLGPAGYGLWAVITSFTGMVQAFVGFRTLEPLTQQLVEARVAGRGEQVRLLLATAMVVDLAAALLGCLVVVMGAPLVARHAAPGAPLAAFVLFALSTVFNFAGNAWYAVMRDRKRFQVIGAVPVLVGAVQLGVVIALWATRRLDLLALAATFLGAAILRCGVKLALLRRDLRAHYGLAHLRALPFGQVLARRAELGAFWAFMWNTYLSSLITTVIKNGDVLILGVFRPAAEVGVFRLAKSLIVVLSNVLTALTSAIYQDFNELLASGERRRIAHGLRRLVRLMLPIVAGATLLALLLARPAIVSIYGAEFAPAAMLFQVMMLGTSVSILLFWAHPLLLALGEYRYYLRLCLMLGGAWIAAMVVAAWAQGALALSVVYVVFAAAMQGACVLRVRRRLAEPDGPVDGVVATSDASVC